MSTIYSAKVGAERTVYSQRFYQFLGSQTAFRMSHNTILDVFLQPKKNRLLLLLLVSPTTADRNERNFEKRFSDLCFAIFYFFFVCWPDFCVEFYAGIARILLCFFMIFGLFHSTFFFFILLHALLLLDSGVNHQLSSS